jgi:hypothetical protein
MAAKQQEESSVTEPQDTDMANQARRANHSMLLEQRYTHEKEVYGGYYQRKRTVRH